MIIYLSSVSKSLCSKAK